MVEVSGSQEQSAHISANLEQDTLRPLLDERLTNMDMSHSRGLMVRLLAAFDRQGMRQPT